jgi:hypothetical protein
MKYNIGDEVYWTDPDNNICSGIYKVKEIISIDERVYLIGNESSETEVFESELS